jgi:septal ring factor EnvC (AmiA/AmiB activator)
VLLGVALGGVDHQPAVAAPRETPARRIARLRAKAARVQARIDRMHTRIEVLVEDYNEVREALARTRAEQARTRRQVVDARRHLRAAKRELAKRLWTIYTGGAPSALGRLLAADNVHQALVTTKYQEQMVGADRAAIDRVDRLRRDVKERRRQALLRRLAAERAAGARAAAGGWWRGQGGAGAPSGVAGERSPSHAGSSASNTCGARPARAATTAPG